jgi:RimJ/RimL family protein N-acetyltransferase
LDWSLPPSLGLRLEVPSVEHASGLDSLLNDPVVADWLGGARRRDTIEQVIAEERKHWHDHGFGPWVVLDAATEAVVGRGGIRWARVRERDEVELFYAVAPRIWGRGVATELSRAALELGFSRPDVSSIVGFTIAANEASQKVLRKLGFVEEGTFEHAGQPHTLLRLLRP